MTRPPDSRVGGSTAQQALFFAPANHVFGGKLIRDVDA